MQDSSFEVHLKVPIQLHRWKGSQDHSELSVQHNCHSMCSWISFGIRIYSQTSIGSISSDVSSNALRFAASSTLSPLITKPPGNARWSLKGGFFPFY